MKQALSFATIMTLVGSLLYKSGLAGQAYPRERVESFLVHPVGRIHKRGNETTIEIESKYQEALLGLEDFSHVWVLWWFDRNDNPDKRALLRVHPQGNKLNSLTGVFATRSPARPNIIGTTLCKIRSIHGSTVHVESIDALDNTPVLDLKPHIPKSDGVDEATVASWIESETG